MSRSSSQTTSCVRPIANDGTSSTPPASCDHPHGLGEEADGLALGLVFAAAVRGLDEDVVRGVERRGVAQDRRPGAAEVAGADDDPLLPARRVRHPQADDRRAEDVPGVEERRVDPRRDLELLAVADGPERRERSLGVLRGVERRVEVDLEVRRLGAQLGLGVAWPGLGLRRVADRLDGRLDVLPVPERHGAGGGAGGSGSALASPASARATAAAYVSSFWRSSAAALSGWRFSQRASRFANSSWSLPESSRTSVASSIVPGVAWIGPAIAGLHEEREQPAMVEVGVGQQHGVEGRGVEIERDPVADRLVRAALEHPAVDEDPRLAGLEQVLRARDGRGSAEEVDLHRAHDDRGRARRAPCGRGSSPGMIVTRLRQPRGRLGRAPARDRGPDRRAPPRPAGRRCGLPRASTGVRRGPRRDRRGRPGPRGAARPRLHPVGAGLLGSLEPVDGLDRRRRR